MIENLYAFLRALGFSQQDIISIILCPLFAGLGSTVHGTMLESDLSSFPVGRGRFSDAVNLTVASWYLQKVAVGMLSGLLLALALVGAFKEGASELARLLGLAMLVGYSAPKLWLRQEKLLLAAVDKHMRDVLKSETSKHGEGAEGAPTP